MRQLLSAIFLTVFASSGGLAAECPAARDHSEEMQRLIDAIQAAPNEQAARVISNDMWALWAEAPDAAAQETLDAGMTRRSSYDFLGAIAEFDRLIAYCPNYAEGYNQRAFVNFMRQDFATALPDLDRALALSPRHIAARAGRALTLMGLGRQDEAQAELRAALALNPWLSERGLLVQPKGQDL